MSGGVRVASAVPELDKVDEFSAWTGINAAELGQVGARAGCCLFVVVGVIAGTDVSTDASRPA